jgi:hypothetical protein
LGWALLMCLSPNSTQLFSQFYFEKEKKALEPIQIDH